MLKLIRGVKGSKNEFLRNVVTLMTGATLAQAIPIAAMPILTRLYTPDEFGVLALYISVAAMISVVINARYEIAVMLPERDEDAAGLVVLSIGIASVISLILFVLIITFNDVFQDFLNNKKIGPWLYLIPVTVCVTGVWQALNYWNNRAKKFKRLAVSRVVQGAGMTAAQVALSVIPGAGLVIGYLIGQVAGVVVFVSKIWKEDRAVLHHVTPVLVLNNAKRYSKFPKYSCFGALLNSAASQMPILMLSRFFDTFLVGVFSLTFRALSLPISLIAASLAQVLFQRLVTLERSSPEKIRFYILKLFSLLLLLMVPVVVIVWAFGPQLFGWVFGEAWSQAGEYAGVLIFAIAIRFAVSPLSTVLTMDHNVKIGAAWQATYFISITTTLFLFRESSVELFIFVLTVHDIVLYGIYLVLILYGASRSSSDLVPGAQKS